MPKYLICHRGEMWPRNISNINAILGSEEGGQGIYVLFDGSTPVYVGRGNIRQRIRQASTSKRRGQSWDHFSWYVVPNAQNEKELEALLLRMLRPHLRKSPGEHKHTTGWPRWKNTTPVKCSHP